MRVLLIIAVRNLLQARLRTALLSTAIGLVTMFLVALLSVSQGIADNLVDAATTISAGHINVAGFHKATPGDAAPIVTHAAELRKVVEEITPNLDYIIDRHRGWAKVVSDTGSMQAGLSGIDVAQEDRFFERLKVVSGEPRRLAEPHTTLLFEAQAENLEVGVGDIVTLQTETLGGQTNTLDATVVAIAEDIGLMSSFNVFVPKADIIELYRMNPDTTGALWVYLNDIDQAAATMYAMRGDLEKRGYELMEYQPAPFFMKFDSVSGEDWTGQKLDLTTWEDEVSFLTWILTAFDTVTWFLALILVAIIAVGIMNALYNAVRERTREIGTMRAIGMTQGQVLGLFLIEATLLGLFATTAGALGGAALAFTVNALQIGVPIQAAQVILLTDTLYMSVNPRSLVTAVVLLTGFTALSALWPALRAARLRPITAIHHIE